MKMEVSIRAMLWRQPWTKESGLYPIDKCEASEDFQTEEWNDFPLATCIHVSVCVYVGGERKWEGRRENKYQTWKGLHIDSMWDLTFH